MVLFSQWYIQYLNVHANVRQTTSLQTVYKYRMQEVTYIGWLQLQSTIDFWCLSRVVLCYVHVQQLNLCGSGRGHSMCTVSGNSALIRNLYPTFCLYTMHSFVFWIVTVHTELLLHHVVSLPLLKVE